MVKQLTVESIERKLLMPPWTLVLPIERNPFVKLFLVLLLYNHGLGRNVIRYCEKKLFTNIYLVVSIFIGIQS